ncbi:MAG: hypothetical protein JXA22_02355 [Candidatus Thermoplasmatota archaeon]|nr:hypothetical protein [Candidatus Thermoplasmatota archaeon]
MSAERKALDRDRIRRALDLNLTAMTDRGSREGLSIERDSLVENIGRLTIEEDSLITSDRVDLGMVLEDYSRDLAELERSLFEYREYLRKLRERDLMG